LFSQHKIPHYPPSPPKVGKAGLKWFQVIFQVMDNENLTGLKNFTLFIVVRISTKDSPVAFFPDLLRYN